MIVNLVVDPVFGERLIDLVARGPVWIADTKVNRPAAERWWRHNSGAPANAGVTTFQVDLKRSSEQWVADILAMIEMHFGAYDDDPPTYEALDVWGAILSEELRNLLTTAGYSNLVPLQGGFRAINDAAAV
jgi:hypothetical protein